jgi:hypothetical protein
MKRFAFRGSWGRKEMNMIRHHDIASDGPAMTFMQAGPLVAQDVMDGWCRQQWPSSGYARGDEIDRLILPHERQAAQMPLLGHEGDEQN